MNSINYLDYLNEINKKKKRITKLNSINYLDYLNEININKKKKKKKRVSRDPRACWAEIFVVLLVVASRHLKKKKSLFGMRSEYDPSA